MKHGHRSFFWTTALIGAALGCESAATRPTPAAAPVVSATTTTTTNPVRDMAVLWSEAVLENGKVPVAQGFVAKIYLFAPGSHEPVAGTGKLTITAYDETEGKKQGTAEEKVKPDRIWQFEGLELNAHLQKDLIGACYSVWLPFGPPSGKERRCTLIACFKPEAGPGIASDASLVTLPGVPTLAGPAAAPIADSGTKPAGMSAAQAIAATTRRP